MGSDGGTRHSGESAQSPAIRVSVVSIAVNAVLALFKFLAGVLGNSGAMISDAIDSASDVLSAGVAFLGVALSGRKSDQSHPYGHERMECLMSIVLAAGLFASGMGIGIEGVRKIVGSVSGQLRPEDIPVPTLLPLAAAVISIGVKLWLFCYTRATARRLNSTVLMANAWNYRNDAFASVGSLIGIGGARLGLPVLDPIASVLICGLILKAAYDICKDAIDQMVDRSCDDATTAEIREIVRGVEGVQGVDLLMTRMFGSKFYVDIEISVDGNQTLSEAHTIAQNVHDAVEQRFPNAKHCMVHMNPSPVPEEKEPPFEE